MMFNRNLLLPQVQAYIDTHLREDLPRLILKGSPFDKVSMQEIAVQIRSKRKAEKKLPEWFAQKDILYPPALNLSQSSSAQTAAYKSALVSGDTLIDITGGFGVDSYFFAQKMKRVIYCEQNEGLCEIARHNFALLPNRNNSTFIPADGITCIKQQSGKVDWIYADPGRRTAAGDKVFRLEDCEPDILAHINTLKAKTARILLKTSPLLDLRSGIRQLKNVYEIHVVAVNNEVKELLWLIGETPVSEIQIKTVNLRKNDRQSFCAGLLDETAAVPVYALPQTYLYEPNAAVLKAGFFNILTQAFAVKKLAPNSHLYTSDKKTDFPGRSFVITGLLSAHTREFKKTGIKKANITVRNFPESVAQIRKKYKLKEGGDQFLFFTQNQQHEKIIIICKKI